MNLLTKKIVRIGVISALYVVLSMIVFPIASGFIQFRLSEALCLLPLIFPETCVSLFLGCAVTNFITDCALFDVLLGSLVTLVSALFTAIIGNIIKNSRIKYFIGGLFPVVLNAVGLPLIWYLCYGKQEYIYIIQFVSILVSEALAVYAVGVPLCVYVQKISAKNKN